jgi:hypothetical protein
MWCATLAETPRSLEHSDELDSVVCGGKGFIVVASGKERILLRKMAQGCLIVAEVEVDFSWCLHKSCRIERKGNATVNKVSQNRNRPCRIEYAPVKHFNGQIVSLHADLSGSPIEADDTV